MSILFDDTRSGTRSHGRAITGLWLSVGLHIIAAAAFAVVPIRAFEKPPAPRRQSIEAFILTANALPKMPSAPLIAPRRRPAPERVRAETPKPLPVDPVIAKAIAPAPGPVVAVTIPVVERTIEQPVVPRSPETGLFERATVVRTNQAATAVTTGAFGNTAASPRNTANDAAVKTGGFGSEAPAPRRAANAVGDVQTAGFDKPAGATAQLSVAAAKPIDRPVEIVFKPTPEYTGEARSARIEGTVSLELEFTAAGDIRVLRVVRGLGHGLDEAAQRAALRIRFKPAQSDGRPVDSRATVHITFRLS
jgi:TonB family protein